MVKTSVTVRFCDSGLKEVSTRGECRLFPPGIRAA